MSNFKLIFLFLITLLQTNFAFSEIKVLLLDGQNNHNWKATTPVIVEALERDNLCKVTVSTSPPKKSSQDEWKTWKPNFQNYDVTLTNYNGEMWPEDVQKKLIN